MSRLLLERENARQAWWADLIDEEIAQRFPALRPDQALKKVAGT
jgi:hypothetical protein